MSYIKSIKRRTISQPQVEQQHESESESVSESESQTEQQPEPEPESRQLPRIQKHFTNNIKKPSKQQDVVNSYKKNRKRKSTSNDGSSTSKTARVECQDNAQIYSMDEETSKENMDDDILFERDIDPIEYDCDDKVFTDIEYAPEYVQNYSNTLLETFKNNACGFKSLKKNIPLQQLSSISSCRPTIQLRDGSIIVCELFIYITWKSDGNNRERAVPGLLVSIQKNRTIIQKCISVQDLLCGFLDNFESRINCMLMLHCKYNRDVECKTFKPILIPHPISICGDNYCNANAVVTCSTHWASMCRVHFHKLKIPEEFRKKPPVLNGTFCICNSFHLKPTVVARNEIQEPLLVFNYNLMTNGYGRDHRDKNWSGVHEGFHEFYNMMICPGYVDLNMEDIEQLHDQYKTTAQPDFCQAMNKHSTNLIDKLIKIKPKRLCLSYIFHTQKDQVYLAEEKVLTTITKFITYLDQVFVQMSTTGLSQTCECVVFLVGCDLIKYKEQIRALPKCKNQILLWTSITTKFEDFILTATQIRLNWQDHKKPALEVIDEFIKTNLQHTGLEMVHYLDDQCSSIVSKNVHDGSILSNKWNKYTHESELLPALHRDVPPPIETSTQINSNRFNHKSHNIDKPHETTPNSHSKHETAKSAGTRGARKHKSAKDKVKKLYEFLQANNVRDPFAGFIRPPNQSSAQRTRALYQHLCKLKVNLKQTALVT